MNVSIRRGFQRFRVAQRFIYIQETRILCDWYYIFVKKTVHVILLIYQYVATWRMSKCRLIYYGSRDTSVVCLFVVSPCVNSSTTWPLTVTTTHQNSGCRAFKKPRFVSINTWLRHDLYCMHSLFLWSSTIWCWKTCNSAWFDASVDNQIFMFCLFFFATVVCLLLNN